MFEICISNGIIVKDNNIECSFIPLKQNKLYPHPAKINNDKLDIHSEFGAKKMCQLRKWNCQRSDGSVVILSNVAASIKKTLLCCKYFNMFIK